MVLLVTINYEHRDPAVFKTPLHFYFLTVTKCDMPKQWHGMIWI